MLSLRELNARAMKKIWILMLLVGPFLMAQQPGKTIRGKVTDGRSPLANVAISVEGGSDSTFSAAPGIFATQ